MQKFEAPIPLSLYIHLPWCIQKCPYCDFNSHKAPDHLPEALYIQRMMQDLEALLPLVWGRRLRSIFFGGGTPSLFSADSIRQILESVYGFFRYGPETEITLEANPGTLDETRFKGFFDAGVNRLSIGLQSLQDAKLKLLGRVHNREYALRAIEVAKKVGFQNINLDLMHGLPEQTVDEALQDLQDALQFQTPHLSWYQLTIEPNTYFHHHRPTLPAEKTLWDIQEQGKKLLIEQGYVNYEVSAFAQKNRECEHNLNYWEFGDYLGIGAGAHNKITLIDEGKIQRHAFLKNPRDFLTQNENRLIETRLLSESDTSFEFVMNALRLTQGVSLKLFSERTGLRPEALEPQLQKAKEKGLILDEKDRLCATELGLRFLNDLLEMFLGN